MTDAPAAPKPKKSVALSGVAAGNTALCTVGRTGNDLAYRGYDILDIADACEFEEIAYLLDPRQAADRARSSRRTRRSCSSLRGLPEPVKEILERVPAAAHPMDVLRSGVSALGTVLPEKDDHERAGRPRQRRPAAGLARLDARSTGITGATTASASTSRPTTTRSAATFSTCCTAARRNRCGSGRCTPRSSSTPSTSSTRRRSPRA